jgi:hypothetical protein
MLSAQQLYQAAALDPSALGPDIVNPDLDDDSQRAAVIAFLESDVLPVALSEVSVPFMRASGFPDVTAFIDAKFSDKTEEQRGVLAAPGVALYDAAAKSYGRSELDKLVDSNAQSYDRDSDQNRIQGNQRLEKLLGWVGMILDLAQGDEPGDSESGVDDVPVSGSARITPVWF